MSLERKVERAEGWLYPPPRTPIYNLQMQSLYPEHYEYLDDSKDAGEGESKEENSKSPYDD